MMIRLKTKPTIKTVGYFLFWFQIIGSWTATTIVAIGVVSPLYGIVVFIVGVIAVIIMVFLEP